MAQDVSEGRLDFAVVPTSFDLSETLLSTPMGTDRECFVCAVGRPLPIRNGGVILAELGALKLVLPGAANARRQRVQAYLDLNGIEVQDVLELDTMHGTLDLVARSDWVSILPSILCLPDLDGTRRQVVPLVEPALNVNYMRIQTRKRPLNMAAQAFADILQEELNSALEITPMAVS